MTRRYYQIGVEEGSEAFVQLSRCMFGSKSQVATLDDQEACHLREALDWRALDAVKQPSRFFSTGSDETLRPVGLDMEVTQ